MARLNVEKGRPGSRVLWAQGWRHLWCLRLLYGIPSLTHTEGEFLFHGFHRWEDERFSGTPSQQIYTLPGFWHPNRVYEGWVVTSSPGASCFRRRGLMRLRENPVISDGFTKVELILLIDRITVLFVLKETTGRGAWSRHAICKIIFYKKHPMCLTLLGNFMSFDSHGPSARNVPSGFTQMTSVRRGCLCI